MVPRPLEITDLLWSSDADGAPLPVLKADVLGRLRALGQRRAARIVSAIPAADGILVPGYVDALGFRVHCELQRFGEELLCARHASGRRSRPSPLLPRGGNQSRQMAGATDGGLDITVAGLEVSHAAQLDPDEPAIFNFHDPPARSGLDMAYKMTADMKVEMAAGQAMLAPVGSTSVRDLIERAQPLLSLHGYIHESRAARKIGRTVAINPGSASPKASCRE